jgi:tellurite resistance protein TerC
MDSLWALLDSVFPDTPDANNGDATTWAVFAVAFAIALFCDRLVVRRDFLAADQRKSMRNRIAVLHLIFWTAVAASFGFFVRARHGAERMEKYFSQFFIEILLDMDQIYAYGVILRSYSTPPEQTFLVMHHYILPALVLRIALYYVVTTIYDFAVWLSIPVGLFIMYNGIKVAFEDAEGEEGEDVKDMLAVRLLSKLRFNDAFDSSGSLVVRGNDGLRHGSMMLLVALATAIVDAVLAVDAVILKITRCEDMLVNCTTAAWAFFLLRTLHFIIERLQSLLAYMNYGVAAILIFLGAKIAVDPIWDAIYGDELVSMALTNQIIAGIFVSAIVISLCCRKGLTRPSSSPKLGSSLVSGRPVSPNASGSVNAGTELQKPLASA